MRIGRSLGNGTVVVVFSLVLLWSNAEVRLGGLFLVGEDRQGVLGVGGGLGVGDSSYTLHEDYQEFLV